MVQLQAAICRVLPYSKLRIQSYCFEFLKVLWQTYVVIVGISDRVATIPSRALVSDL